MKNLEQAFAFPFKGRSWGSKFLLAALFMFLSLLGIGVFFIAGYLIRVTQRVMRNEPDAMPEWKNLSEIFVIGFKFIIVYIIYLLPVLALTIPLIGLSVASDAAQGVVILEVLLAIYMFGYVLLVIPYGVALTIAMPIIIYRFAANERMAEALDIGEIYGTFKRHWQSTLIVALLSVGIQSLASVGLILFIVGILFTIFYTYLVSAYLAGALYLDSMERERPA